MPEYDGEVIIHAELDSEGFKRDLIGLNKDLRDNIEQFKKLGADGNYKEALNMQKKITEEIEKQLKLETKSRDKLVFESPDLKGTKEFDYQIEKINGKLYTLKRVLDTIKNYKFEVPLSDTKTSGVSDDTKYLSKQIEAKKSLANELKAQYENLSNGVVKTKEQERIEQAINDKIQERNKIIEKLQEIALSPSRETKGDVDKLNIDLEKSLKESKQLNDALNRIKINPAGTQSVKDLAKEIRKTETDAKQLERTLSSKQDKQVSEKAKAERFEQVRQDKIFAQQFKEAEKYRRAELANSQVDKNNAEKQIIADKKVAAQIEMNKERIAARSIDVDKKNAAQIEMNKERIAARSRDVDRSNAAKDERNKERIAANSEALDKKLSNKIAINKERIAANEIALAQKLQAKAEIEQAKAEERAQVRAERAQERIAKEQARLQALASRNTKTFGDRFKSVFSSLSAPVDSVISKITQLGKRILRIGAFVLVFNIIRGAFRQFRDYVSAALVTNNEFMTSLNKIKSNLMVAFYPIYQYILPALNTLMSILVKASSYLANFFSLITGSNIKQNVSGAKAIYDSQQAMKSTGAATDSTTKSIKDQKAAFDKLGKSINGSKKELASFDKLIVLQQDKEKTPKVKTPKSNGFVFTPDVRVDSTYNNMITIFDKISKKIEPLKEKFKVLGETIKVTIGKFAVQAFKDFNAEFAKPLANWFVDRGLPRFIEITDNMLKQINWERLNTSLKDFWKALEPFAEHIGDGLINLYDRVLSKVIVFTIDKALPTTLDALGHSLKWIDDNIGADNVAMSLIVGIGTYKTIETIQNIIKWVNELKKTYENLTMAQIILQAFSGPAGWAALAAGAALAVGVGIKKVNDLKLANMLEYNKKTKKEFENSTYDEQKSLWDNWKAHLQRVYGDVTHGRKEALDKMLKDTGITYEEFNKMDLKQRAELVRNWSASEADAHHLIGKEREQFMTAQSKEIMGSIGGIKIAFEKTSEFFGGLWAELKPKWKKDLNFLIDKVEGFVNLCIKGLNWLIRKANNISFNMPDWLGGGHFGIHMSELQNVSIPRLAQGAVLKGGNPMLAYLNDQPRGQTNIETPLNTMLDAFNQALAQNNNNTGNVVIQADGDVAGIINMLRFSIKQRDELVGTNYIQDGIFA